MHNKIAVFIVFCSILNIIQCEKSVERNNKNIGKTIIDTNIERFQRILRRKKRFLLFPPGAAIVVGNNIFFSSLHQS